MILCVNEQLCSNILSGKTKTHPNHTSKFLEEKKFTTRYELYSVDTD